jgi:predicted phage-related endonuclease
MKVLNISQGSDEWILIRAKYRCASEAPIIMGASKHMTRNQMIHAKKTMQDMEFADFVQKHVLDKGHEVEAATRPLIEAEIGEELYPIVAVDDTGVYFASFDGMLMDESFNWECKQWSEELADLVGKGELDPQRYWQLEHQLLVNGATQALFTVSDVPNSDRRLTLTYKAVPGRREQLIRAWDQFDADVEAYIPVAPKAEAVPTPVKTLPAITYKLNGLALTSNLTEYKAAAHQLVEESRKVLQTDQDFADREALIKGFKEAEEKIKLYKEQVVSEIKDVSEFVNGLTDIAGLIRTARLNSEKQVEQRKEEIRLGIERKAATAFAQHIDTINHRLGKVKLPTIEANFFAAMKGKKSVASLQNAADTLLSQLKIQANEIAEKIDANLRSLRELAIGYEFLFRDSQELVLKNNEDLINLINARINEQKEADRKKEEQIRADAEKATREKVEQEVANAAAAKAESERKATEAKPAPVEQPAPVQVAEQPKPAARTPIPTPQKAVRQRPSDSEIIDAVVAHFGVDRAIALGWLKNADWTLAA